MLLRHSLELENEATAIEVAIDQVLAAGKRTADIADRGSDVSGTADFAEAVVAEIN